MMQIFYILILVGYVKAGGCCRKSQKSMEPHFIHSTNVETTMKIVFISDTHGLHEYLEFPEEMDVLIHSGDFTNDGSNTKEYDDFINWFAKQKAKKKVLISGNRDLFLHPTEDKAKIFEYDLNEALEFRAKLLEHFRKENITYLQDEGAVIAGLKIYGTPWTRTYTGNAFQVDEIELEKYYENIPDQLDILITHGPPYGMLDSNVGAPYGHQGSTTLKKIVEKSTPKVHVFGHIHGGYGEQKQGEIYYINAANQKGASNTDYSLNKPIILKFENTTCINSKQL